jgi:thiamine-monophosphate kinase
MQMSDLGEFGFIARFSPPFLRRLAAGNLGIGDDCAVIPWSEDKSLLVTTDLLVEKVHFLKEKITPRNLGYKSLAVNLSDLASMGGRAGCAFLSLAIPPEMEVEWLDEFFAGWQELAEASQVSLMGGDTTRSPGPFVVNVALLGFAATARIKTRAGARKGDLACVTDFLGDSAGGLKIILENLEEDQAFQKLVEAHYRPRPALEEGQWLAGFEGVHALMDVSDGIDSDLRRIMERSGVGVEVYLDKLPVSAALSRLASHCGFDAAEMAALGGEDYCLLLALAPEAWAEVSHGFQACFNRPLWPIGMFTDEREGLRYRKNGRPVELSRKGFHHFSSP